MWGSLDLKLWSRSQFFQPTLLDPQIFPRNGPNRPFSKDPIFEYSGSRRSAKTGSDRLDGMRSAFFRIYSGFC